MDWALHQPEVRFDIRAERAEYERLFKHPASVLQDRLFRLGGSDRTKEIPIAEWERIYRKKHKHEYCFIRQGCWAGARRKGITSPTNKSQLVHLQMSDNACSRQLQSTSCRKPISSTFSQKRSARITRTTHHGTQFASCGNWVRDKCSMSQLSGVVPQTH